MHVVLKYGKQQILPTKYSFAFKIIMNCQKNLVKKLKILQIDIQV